MWRIGNVLLAGLLTGLAVYNALTGNPVWAAVNAGLAVANALIVLIRPE